MAMDFEKLMRQAQQMQEQMSKAQEELAKETVEASAGGGMVRVKATGALEITEIKISPEAIDPSDPDLLADMVLAAVNEALRSAQNLVESKLGNAMGGLQGQSEIHGDSGGAGFRNISVWSGNAEPSDSQHQIPGDYICICHMAAP